MFIFKESDELKIEYENIGFVETDIVNEGEIHEVNMILNL